MIDQNKMRALAAHLRGPFGYCTDLSEEVADAIDLLLAEVEAAAADKRRLEEKLADAQKSSAQWRSRAKDAEDYIDGREY